MYPDYLSAFVWVTPVLVGFSANRPPGDIGFNLLAFCFSSLALGMVERKRDSEERERGRGLNKVCA